MKNRNKFHYLLKVYKFSLIKNDKIRLESLVEFGYLPQVFTCMFNSERLCTTRLLCPLAAYFCIARMKGDVTVLPGNRFRSLVG